MQLCRIAAGPCNSSRTSAAEFKIELLVTFWGKKPRHRLIVNFFKYYRCFTTIY